MLKLNIDYILCVDFEDDDIACVVLEVDEEVVLTMLDDRVVSGSGVVTIGVELGCLEVDDD